MEFTKHLSAEARAQFEHFFRLHMQQSDVIAATFHAIYNKDADGFRDGLAKLHPGEEERMVAVVFLSKLADKIHTLKDPEVQKLPVEERIGAISAHRLNFHLYEAFARRFLRRRCREYLETVLDAIRENRGRDCSVCSRQNIPCDALSTDGHASEF